MNNYLELEQSLLAKGIGSYLQNPDLLVVSNVNPAMPNSNCFWVTNKGGEWFLGTWLPAVYQIPTKKNLSEICEAVFNSAQKAIFEVNETLAAKLNLRRLAETEIEAFGFDE